MKRSNALNFLISMVIGAVFFGTAFSPLIRNAHLATVLGAVGGMFICWIFTAAFRENASKEDDVLCQTINKKLKPLKQLEYEVISQ